MTWTCQNCGHTHVPRSSSHLPILVCEKRTPDGALDFSGPQPSRYLWNQDMVATEYYRRNAGTKGVSMDDMYAWFKQELGWHFRPKTW